MVYVLVKTAEAVGDESHALLFCPIGSCEAELVLP